jgi:hypothetical protein
MTSIDDTEGYELFKSQDTKPDISLKTRAFLVNRLDEMLLACSTTFFAFSDKNPSQYVTIKRSEVKDPAGNRYFNGKLDVILIPAKVKGVNLPKNTKGEVTLPKGVTPNEYQKTIARMDTVQNVVRFIVLLWNFSQRAVRNKEGKSVSEFEQAADACARKIAEDRQLVIQLVAISKVMFIEEQFAKFGTLAARVYSAPKEGDFFINDALFDFLITNVLSITRAMKKVVLNCQRLIPFMAIYGISTKSEWDANTVLPAQFIDGLANAYEESLSSSIDVLAISQSPRFYSLCEAATFYLCPLFRDFVTELDADGQLKAWHTHKSFVENLKIVMAFLFSVVTTSRPREMARNEAEFNKRMAVQYRKMRELARGIKKNEESLIFAELKTAFEGIYEGMRRMAPYVRSDEYPSVFAVEKNPRLLRKIYTRKVIGLYNSTDPGGKKFAGRLITYRTLIFIAARIRVRSLDQHESEIEKVLENFTDAKIYQIAAKFDPAQVGAKMDFPIMKS